MGGFFPTWLLRFLTFQFLAIGAWVSFLPFINGWDVGNNGWVDRSICIIRFEGLEQEGLVPSLSLHTRDASTLPTLYRDEPSSGPGFDRSSGPSETPAASPTTDTATSSHPFESQSTEGKASDDAVWKGFEGWLPPEGVKSLDVRLFATLEAAIHTKVPLHFCGSFFFDYPALLASRERISDKRAAHGPFMEY